jgi:hypothetical protein
MNPWNGLMVSVLDRPGLACKPRKKPGAKRALPTTPARLQAAAAMVHAKSTGKLCLVPVIAADFYEMTDALPDLCQLDREGNAEGHPRAGDVPVRAWSEVGVPAAACDVSAVHPGAAGRGGCANRMEGARG